MSELIYKQDAITELVFNEETKDIKCEDMRKVLNVLKKLPSAEPEQQWIPCSETKENPDHEILACGRRGEMIIGYLVEYSDDQWLCESETEILYDAMAWREKPKPYTERRSQDD